MQKEFDKAYSELSKNLERISSHTPVTSAGEGLFKVGETPRLLISAVVHGDELGGLHFINSFLAQFTIQSPPVALVIGNIEAGKLNKRYLEKDLNRAFGIERPQNYEEERAIQISNFGAGIPFFIDLHQTRQPTQSDFFIYPETEANIKFASQTGRVSPHIIHGFDFSMDGQTLDTYFSTQGKTAITYEMGNRGFFPQQIKKTNSIVNTLLSTIICGDLISHETPDFFIWHEVFLNSKGGQLTPGLKNFSKVKAGQILGTNAEGLIRAKEDGVILFPKYGEMAKASTELCRLARNIPRHQITPLKPIENSLNSTII